MTKKTASKKSSAKKSKPAKPVKKAAKPVKKTAKSSTRTSAKKVKTQKKSAPASSKKKTTVSKKASKLSPRETIIQKIKQDLINQKELLLKEAEETISSLPSELNFPDMGDQASAEADRNFMLRLRDRERMLLKKIDETIERIENGPYGVCEECDSKIGIKRLEARPVTTLCIECKTQQEEKERISEGG